MLHIKDESDIKNLREKDFEKSIKILKGIIKPEDFSRIDLSYKEEVKNPNQSSQNGMLQPGITSKLPNPPQKS